MKIKRLLALVLAFLMILCFTACGESKSGQALENSSNIDNTGKTAPKFKVTVIDNEGNSVDGVVLKMRKTTDFTAISDRNGVATFNMYVTDGYRLTVVHCPDGYEYTGDKDIHIKSGTMEYTLEINKK